MLYSASTKRVVALRIRSSFTVAAAAVTFSASPFLLTSCIIPSPSPGATSGFTAVAAVSASNVWAVGGFTDRRGEHELMEHWNGKGWQTVSLPSPVGTDLTAITAVNASNVWAVGTGRTLHFNGLSWRSVANPLGEQVLSVTSAPGGLVYGIGSTATSASLLRMSPGGWRTVATIPKPTSHRSCDGGSERPVALAAMSAQDIWVVGNTFNTVANTTHSCTFTLRWNGTTWQPIATPSGAGEPELTAVSARAANDVWAVGERTVVFAPTGNEVNNSLVIHWNGTKWSTVPTVDSHGGGWLFDVDATAGGVWAVGNAPQLEGETTDILIKKWTGEAMVDQPVQRLPIAGQPFLDSGSLNGVSVAGGVVTSVGGYSPTITAVATLTDRRNAG